MASKTRSPNFSSDLEEEGLIKKFHFFNGDSYSGDFSVVKKNYIIKDGFGIYKTKSSDLYETNWNNDRFGETIKIRFHDATVYKGGITPLGDLQGGGRYIFPDASYFQAKWSGGILDDDFSFVESNHNYIWSGKQVENKIVFTPPNNFWNAIESDQKIKQKSNSYETSSYTSQISITTM